MKKLMSLTLVLVLVLSLFAGCTKDTKKSEIDFRVGFVTDTGGIDDKSFNQGTWEGIVKYAEEKDWKQGDEYTYVQSNDEAQYIPNLSAFGDEKYDLVIAAGFLFNDAMTEVSKKYPDTKFAIIDTVVDNPNVASITFAEHQGSFLVGVAAAKATKTNKVGFVGGMDFPLIRKFHAGFVAGVKSVNPNIEVVDQYAGSFGDPGLGQSIASTMYEQGVDVIYHAAGGTGNGVINEAKNRAENGENVWVIGVDKDQYQDGVMENGKSVVLTSMMKRVDVAAYNAIDSAIKGEFPGGKVTTLTLAENGVGIPDENPNLSDDVVKVINDYREQIISGKITVPETMEELDAFLK